MQTLKQLKDEYNTIELPLNNLQLNSEYDDCLLSPNLNRLTEINKVIYPTVFKKLKVEDVITRYGATLALRLWKISILNIKSIEI